MTLSNPALYELVQLELDEHAMRKTGRLDEAAALQSLARAVRLEQLTPSQLYSSRWRVFGGRQLES